MRGRRYLLQGVAAAVMAALTGGLAAQAPVPAGQSVGDWALYMTEDELAVFAALQSSVNAEGVEAVVLPVGSWGKRIAERAEVVAELRALNADLGVREAMDLAKSLDGDEKRLFPGAGSDYDITVALKDVPGDDAFSKELAVIKRAEARVAERFGPDRKDLVKIMGERAWHYEKFSGEAGRTFALYSSPYAVRFRAGTPPTRIPVEAYYTLRGATVPKGLGNRATVWLDDAMGIITDPRVAAGTGLSPDVARARAAIKYWKKFEVFFETELKGSLPPDLQASLAGRLDRMPDDVRDLLDLDSKALEARLKVMAKYTVKTADGTEVTALDAFFDRTLKSMGKYRDQVEVVDLVRRGRLAPTVTAVATTLSRWELVQQALVRAAGRVSRSAATHLLMLPALRSALEKYTSGDAMGFSREVAGMMADLAGVGEAALVAEVADLGRELASAGLIAAADAALFEPANQRLLAEYYNSAAAEHGVFSWEESPFNGLARESLYARYRMDPSEARRAIAADAKRYVDALAVYKGELRGASATLRDMFWRMGFLTSGPGSLTDALTAALMADWERSRIDAEAVMAWASRLNQGYYVGQIPPLDVMVDGAPVLPNATKAIAWQMRPGEARSVTVDLVRRYGRRFGTGDMRAAFASDTERRQSFERRLGQVRGGLQGQMLDVFEKGFDVGTKPKAPGLPEGAPVRLHGRAAVERWVQSNTGLFEGAPLDIAHRTITACPGWEVRAPWTAGPGWQAALALQHPNVEDAQPEVASWAFEVRLQAPAEASTDCRPEEEVTIGWKAPFGQEVRRYEIRVRAEAPQLTVTAKGFSLTGAVANRNTGAPIPGAEVVLVGPTTLTGTTNANGDVRFADVPPGSYQFTVTHAGFHRLNGPVEMTDHQRGNFRLTPLPDAPAVPAAVPATASAAAPGDPITTTFPASFGDKYVPFKDKTTDVGQVFTFEAPGPGSLAVTYRYKEGKRLTMRYFDDESGYRGRAVVTFSGPVGRPARVFAGDLYRWEKGKAVFVTEAEGKGTISVTGPGTITLKAYPEFTYAYQYSTGWVDISDGNHTHYVAGSGTITVTFTPSATK